MKHTYYLLGSACFTFVMLTMLLCSFAFAQGCKKKPQVPLGFIKLQTEGGDYEVYIDRHEVTQSSYMGIMGVNPSKLTGELQRPVDSVSWFDAVEYCNRRSIKEGLNPCYSIDGEKNPDKWAKGWNNDEDDNGQTLGWNAFITDETYTDLSHNLIVLDVKVIGYRIPTFTEWRLAFKGVKYSGSPIYEDVAWFAENSNGTTHPVGTKKPNEIGVFDMNGNVSEWVWDSDFNPISSFKLGGPVLEKFRSICGGSYFDPGSITEKNAQHTEYEYVGNTINMSAKKAWLGFRVCYNVPTI